MSNSLMTKTAQYPIKVVIIDDSPLVQRLLSTMFAEDPELEVVGVASDPYQGRDLIKQLNPDVITLDIEMPKMDGLSFLKNLMRLRPMPVVMVSSLTQKGAEVTLDCLAHGAVDFIAKPTSRGHGIIDIREELIRKVKMAANSNYARVACPQNETSHQQFETELYKGWEDWLIAIGASTGGIVSLESVLAGFTRKLPPIIVTQHIPKAFSSSLVERLNKNFPFDVVEGEEGLIVAPGMVCIAPGDKHLTLSQGPNGWVCRLLDTEPVNNHKPSVDVMFQSLLKHNPSKIITVMLSGMGSDGAIGMEQLHNLGSYAIAQDKESCIVWGMPGSVVERNAADIVLNVNKIGKEIEKYLFKHIKRDSGASKSSG